MCVCVCEGECYFVVVKNLNNTACSMHVSSACKENDTVFGHI